MSESVNRYVIPAGWVEAPYIEATHIINGRGEIVPYKWDRDEVCPCFCVEGELFSASTLNSLGIIGLKRKAIEFEVAPRWFGGSLVVFCSDLGLTEGQRYRFVATPIEGGTE